MHSMVGTLASRRNLPRSVQWSVQLSAQFSTPIDR